MADSVEFYPSSAEVSEPEIVEPQIPGISPLQIDDNVWHTDPTLDLQDPRFGLMLVILKPKLRFPQHFPPRIEPSELDCVELFMKVHRILHLLLHTHAGIPMDAE
jgi:hypothetical protein